jgi:TRAP-type C4-dicarboxylate transport system permease small subunit
MTTQSKTGKLAAIRKGLLGLSGAIAWFEARFTGAIVAVILLLLLANVVSRALGQPLIWTDELAVYLMVLGAFAGASYGIARRQHIAVSLIAEVMSRRSRRILAYVVDITLLLLFACFGWMLWNWFDPIGVLTADSLQQYARENFNFLYQEPTTTLGVRKLWFWLIMPVFCFSGFVHLLARFGAMPETR